jgi:benzil reductase ((S)-benzoin forming)
MKKHLTILTGASRGMGLGMALLLVQPGHTLLCISRKTSALLADQAAKTADATVEQWTLDLADGAPVSARLQQWLQAQNGGQFASATLINNAAVLPKISSLADADFDNIAVAMRVNLEAPMQLTAAFLSATGNWPGERKVLNISSGNGRRAMASQSIYSAAKAGMDHYTRCVALEEAARPNGAKLCSLAPGIIDTDMQTHLRNTDPADFPSHATFVSFKENGDLLTPEAAAKRVLDYLARADFGINPVGDVRDPA